MATYSERVINILETWEDFRSGLRDVEYFLQPTSAEVARAPLYNRPISLMGAKYDFDLPAFDGSNVRVYNSELPTCADITRFSTPEVKTFIKNMRRTQQRQVTPPTPQTLDLCLYCNNPLKKEAISIDTTVLSGRILRDVLSTLFEHVSHMKYK